MALGPAVFHKASSVKSCWFRQGQSRRPWIAGFDAADVLFETAVGVVVDDLLYEITNSYRCRQLVCLICYWLTLEAPVR